MIEVDTTNILFVCGGAFVGLDDIVKRRLNVNTSMGFMSNFESLLVIYTLFMFFLLDF